MSARFTVPGLGTVTRDGAGAWVLEGLDGQARPMPAEYQPLLERIDTYQRQLAALELTASKLSPRVPAIWDGPMPGDTSRSFSSSQTVPISSSLDFYDKINTGNLFIKSIYFYYLATMGNWTAGTVLDNIMPLVIYLKDSEVLRLRSANFVGKIDVNLILGPGRVVIRVFNTTSSTKFVYVCPHMWERVPPVKR